MNKYKKKIIGAIILIVLIIIAGNIISKKQNETNNDKEEKQSNTTIEELKEEYKYTGSQEIYEIDTELNGRQVIKVKASINYKVAFCGLIKNDKPNFEEIDSLFEKNYPTENGIWIIEKDREKILKYLNNNKYTNCKYEINENGYLQINQKVENVTSYDKKIETLINSEKQYIIAISSICYMIEPVSGEIVDNPYNELDQYQTYEYFTDESKMFISITENKENKMTKEEIFKSIIDLI